MSIPASTFWVTFHQLQISRFVRQRTVSRFSIHLFKPLWGHNLRRSIFNNHWLRKLFERPDYFTMVEKMLKFVKWSSFLEHSTINGSKIWHLIGKNFECVKISRFNQIVMFKDVKWIILIGDWENEIFATPLIKKRLMSIQNKVESISRSKSSWIENGRVKSQVQIWIPNLNDLWRPIFNFTNILWTVFFDNFLFSKKIQTEEKRCLCHFLTKRRKMLLKLPPGPNPIKLTYFICNVKMRSLCNGNIYQ